MVLDNFVGDISKPGLGDRERAKSALRCGSINAQAAAKAALSKRSWLPVASKVFWAARARAIIASMSFVVSLISRFQNMPNY